MSERYIKTIGTDEIATGGMKAVELGGKELVICNYGGKYYAIQRRCSLMSAPLEKGTLDGIYLTCPMHCAQFDITNGEALSGPVPLDDGDENPNLLQGRYLQNVEMLMKHVSTGSLRTYSTKIADGWVQIML